MADAANVWRHRTGEIRLDRTRVMGILNVTPDSFSDGGRYLDPDQAFRRGIEMVEQGADLLDVGGESTRPGSDPVSAEEEWRRVGPVMRDLAAKVDVPLSVDTMKPEVAAKAIEVGASIVNDVSGLREPDMVHVVARSRVGAVVMHMLGNPVVVGVSRKSFIERLGGGEPGERLPGSIAAATLAVAKGVHVVRVHDVRETVRAMRVADAVLRGEKL